MEEVVDGLLKIVGNVIWRKNEKQDHKEADNKALRKHKGILGDYRMSPSLRFSVRGNGGFKRL